MKKTFVKTREFIYLDSESVWEYIELKKDVDTLYPEGFNVSENIQKYIKNVEYILLPDEMLHCYGFERLELLGYGITSFGRIFNVKHAKQPTPYYKLQKSTLDYSIRNIIVSTVNEFNKLGWNHDIEIILNNFRTNNWKILDKPTF